MAVEAADDAALLEAVLDLRDVPEAHVAAVGILLDDRRRQRSRGVGSCRDLGR